MKARRRPSSRTQTAYHEAGHAVVAIVLGMQVARVRLFVRGGGSFYFDRRQRRPNTRDYVTGLWGGVCAEILLTGDMFDWDMWRASTGDYKLAFYAVRKPTQRHIRYINALRPRAVKFLKRYWPYVERLAKALLRHGELRTRQIARLTREINSVEDVRVDIDILDSYLKSLKRPLKKRSLRGRGRSALL
jgi:hypothetical protein